MRYTQPIFYGALVVYFNEEDNPRISSGISNDPQRLLNWLISRPISSQETSRKIEISDLMDVRPEVAVRVRF
jgi:hypothetical protein